MDAGTSLNKISYFDIRRRVNNLSEADLKTLSEEQVSNRVARIIDQYPLQIRKLELSGLYRAQKNGNGELFTHAKRLWHPSPEHVKRPGRLNKARQVRFYAANMSNATTLELDPKIGDVFTVLVARTKDEAISMDVAFIGVERSKSFDLNHFTKQDMFRTSPSFQQQLGEKNYKKWLLIDDYLSTIFGAPVSEEEEHKYKPTIALAELLFSCPYLDAINYPSVATNDHGINICMLPEKVDELFYPSDAWMIRVEAEDTHPDTGEKLQRISFLRRSSKIDSDGKIHWLPEGHGITQDNILGFTRQRMQTLKEMPESFQSD